MMIQSIIRTLITYIVILVLTIIGALLIIVVGLLKSPYAPFNNRVIRIWASSIIRSSGTRLTVEGKERLDPRQPYVYISNHLSTFDIIATAYILPGTVRFIAKKELFRIPLFAQGMAAAGMIKIDRGNSEEARKTISEAVRVVKNGVSIIVFPEGTRSRTGQIQNFKKGGFILALSGQIPIVPISISGSQYVNRKNSPILRPGRIKLKILEPIETEGMTMEDRNRLLQTVRQKIIDHYEPDCNKA